MEVHNNSNKDNFLKKTKNKLGTRRILAILLIIFSIGCFGFGCIIYGAYLHDTGQTPVLRLFLIRIAEFDFSFIPKFAKGKTVYIDDISIDIKFKNWEKIKYFREKALIAGRINDEMQEEIPARIRYSNQIYRVDLSLTGLMNEHVSHPEKWSLSVKVKDEKTILGMKKFALLVPQSRGYLTDWIATKLLVSQNVIGLRCNFVNVTVNGKNHGVYYLEERYDKRLIENNHYREGIIFKANDYESDIEVYGLKQINESPELSSQLTRLKRLWNGFLSDKIEANKLFDLKKFASIYVVSDLMNGKHALYFINMRLYFNPITGLVEPIGREWGYLRKETKAETETSLTIEQSQLQDHIDLNNNVRLSKIFKSLTFEEEYIKQANILSNPLYLDSLLKTHEEEFGILINNIYKQNPFYVFPLDLLKKNQNYIREKLYPYLPPIEIYFNGINNDSISLYVENMIDLPIEIHSFLYNNRRTIVPDDRILIVSNFKSKKAYQEVNLPFNSEVSNSPFLIDSLEVFYSILGLEHIRKANVLPMEISSDYYSELTPTKQEPNIQKFNFLDIDVNNKHIKFAEKDCNVNEDMIIPKGYVVTANPGCVINLNKSARIISYSPILFFGKTDSLISIISSDSTGQGMVVFDCNQTSELSYVNFKYLSNITDFGWDLRGAITFYNSPVIINKCIFESNLNGDDYLNIIRTDFIIQQTTFANTFADALDTDFCTGTINNVKFLQTGNDAIDISGTKLYISDIIIKNPGDKGLSAGEDSHIICNNINIIGGEIAVASKDKSSIELDNITISSTKIGYCAYQKKSEFGEGVIIANNSKTESVQVVHLIEFGSMLTLNGETIYEKSDKVEEMLYGKQYGKSSK